MKNLILLIFCLTLFSCNNNEVKDENQFYNLDCTIVSFNNNDTEFLGKNNTPTTCNVILIRSIKDPSLYAKLSSCNEGCYFNLSDANLYNKKVGSYVHFIHIKKERFFKINSKDNDNNSNPN